MTLTTTHPTHSTSNLNTASTARHHPQSQPKSHGPVKFIAPASHSHTPRPTHWTVRGNAKTLAFSAFRPAYLFAKKIDSIALEVYEHLGKYFDVGGKEVVL